MLVQICPPGMGGVRDYADCLGRAWRTRGVDSQAIEGAQGGPGRAALSTRLDALMQGCDGALPAPLTVVLHFSGYGYARRGLCHWLVDELRRAKGRHGQRLRLVVVFHELYATGAPWRSAFWLAPVQSLIARRLAAMADALWTNTDHHARWLRSVAGSSKPLRVHPVFSNVGEPVDIPSWDDRHPALVVFGSAATRTRALLALRGREMELRRLGITHLVEAGDGRAEVDDRGSFATRHLGRLSISELGKVLLSSRFGLLDYPGRHLGKSGVFAAYAAHGCVAVNTCPRSGDADGLCAGVHYLAPRSRAPGSAASHAETARRLRHWYAGHTLDAQADALLALANVAHPAPGQSVATAALM